MSAARLLPHMRAVLVRRGVVMVNHQCRTLFSDTHPPANIYFPPVTDTMMPAGCMMGKVAFVTGGGTGLGRGMAEMLSQLGAKVVIMSRKMEVLERTAEEIESKSGSRVLPVSGDVRDPEEVAAAVDKCVAELGLPNIVINNAAGNFIAPFERLSPKGWKTIIDIVLNGTAHVTLDIGKRVIETGSKCTFLAIGATFAQHGSGFVVASASAKAGVEALTKSLASEWARYGMRFNLIAPGPIETKGAMSRLDPTGKFTKYFLDKIPAGRAGEVNELANLACYAVSDYSSWMNGSIINFDGGEKRGFGGQFNLLKRVDSDGWDSIQKLIYATKGS